MEEIFARLTPSAGPAERLAALLHDAPEYVIGDLISPFKAAVGGPYKAIEERIWAAITIRFSRVNAASSPSQLNSSSLR